MGDSVILSDLKFKQAKFSPNYDYIIDSNGNEVDYNDPRLVYVEPSVINVYGRRLVENFYKFQGKNIRFADNPTAETFEYARKLCSGRECLPMMAIVGAVLKDISENRRKDEITIYRLALEQNGPCQNGGWPALWKIFAKELKIENTIFSGTLYKQKNYMGLSLEIYETQVLLYMIGHFITEVKNALSIVASNPNEAIEIFENKTDELILKVKDRKKTLKKGLKEWAREISKIPLNERVEDAPKILIIGGLNLLFTYYPYEEFFLNNGIIPKVVDLTDTTNWLIYEYIMKYNFKVARISSKKQLNLFRIIVSSIFRKHKRDAFKAILARIGMIIIGFYIKKYRKLLWKTGLLFDETISFKDLIEENRKFITCSVFSEVITTMGRYLQSIKSDYYDGIINLGSFNCQPAMNSQALIRPLANNSEMPYIAIDCEGPWLSTNHLRLLETIAIQAKRYHKNKKVNRKNLK